MEIVIKGLCVVAGILVIWFCVELYKKYNENKNTACAFDEDDFVWDFEQDIEDALAERNGWEIKPKKKTTKKAVKKTTKKVSKKKSKK